MSHEPETWASLIRRKRTAKGLLQAQLAEIVKTGQPTISAWERGTGHPSPVMQARLIAALDINAEDLHRAVVGAAA